MLTLRLAAFKSQDEECVHVYSINNPERLDLPGRLKVSGSVYGKQGEECNLLEKPQTFFWSPKGFVYQRHCSLLSGIYRKRRIWGKEGKQISMKTILRDVNMDQNSNLKVYKWKFEKEIENVGT